MNPKPVSILVKNLTISYRVHRHNYSSFKEFILQRSRHRDNVQVVEALRNVNFKIHRGESVALVGHNGCGKSTLLKTLAGIYVAEKAQVQVHGRVGPLIELGAGFDGELSGRENIRLSCVLMGLSLKEVDKRTPSIIQFAELEKYIDLPLKNYSSGMYARLGFACATAIDPDVLLVDEVLAVGDLNFNRKCLSRIHELQQRGTTIVLVSHDENAVRNFCDRAIVFSEGVVQFDGNVEEGLAKHEEIMAERRIRALPEEERQALLKERQREDRPIAEKLPAFKTHFQVLQNDVWTANPDIARPFKVEVVIKVDDASVLGHGVTTRLSLNSTQNLRVGSLTNAELNSPFPACSQGPWMITGTFHFKGIPSLGAATYQLHFDLQDDLGRTLLSRGLGGVDFVNPGLGPNREQDLLPLARFVDAVSFEARATL